MFCRVIRNLSLLTVCLLCSSAHAQTAPSPQFGVVPNGSYASDHVDTVNMENGNDVIHIPLFSLPQQGKLALSFSIVSNLTYWQPEFTCADATNTTCYFEYVAYSPTYSGNTSVLGSTGVLALGPSIVADNLPSIQRNQKIDTACITNPANGTAGAAYYPPLCTDFYSMLYNVVDSDGGSHPLYFDATNVSHLRSTDGSGFLLLSGSSNPSLCCVSGAPLQTGPNVLIKPNGVKETFNLDSTMSQTDPDGNTINVSGSGQITDSVSRVIPAIPQPSTSTVGCPTISGANYQPLVGSSVWQVPGPNGDTVSYLICYAAVSYHTNFFGDGGNTYFTDSYQDVCDVTGWCDDATNYTVYYEEARSTSVAIQSIVLPNKTYWGFVYDSANLSDSTSFAYANLTKLLFPEGGSETYTYGSFTQPCSPDQYPSVSLASRTLSDGNGNSYAWNYFGTKLTDPNGNDTVYEFAPPPWFSGGCSLLEKSRSFYSGSQSSGTLLKRVSTTYQTTPEPETAENTQDTAPASALPITVTTTLDDGSSFTSTTGYGSAIFSANAPECYLGYTFSTNLWVCVPEATPEPTPLNLGIPLSYSINDFSGAALRSSSTSYAWQTNASYLTANVLDTPTVVSTYDGNSAPNLVSQVTTTYDEPSYVSNGGIIAGHATTSSTWLNTNPNAPITTHIGWNTNGKKSYVIDADGHQNTNGHTLDYVYNQCSGLQVSDTYDALNQHASLVYDCTTGQVTSFVDENSQTSQFAYDVMGRLTSVIYPDGGQLTNCFSDMGGPNCTQTGPPFNVVSTRIATPSPLQTASTQFDGLARPIQQKLASGAFVDTSYDGLDQVVTRSNPYISKSDSTYGITSYFYDGLGRMTTQTEQDGNALQWSYLGSTTTSSDEVGNTVTRTLDSLGRLTTVVEPGNLTTNYGYDALNNLLSVMQNGGSGDAPRTRSFRYDSLSRLIAANNPETGNGLACAGVSGNSWSSCYSYDPIGNIQTKTVPAPNSLPGSEVTTTTNYSYDALNRLVSKTYSNAPAGSLSSCYQYGTSSQSATYGIGRLYYSWRQPGACSGTLPQTGVQSWRSITSYDQMGRVKHEQQCTPGNCTTTTTAPYSLQYAYDLAGNLTQANDGIGQASWFHQYNAAGQLSTTTANTLWPSTFYPSQLFSAQGYSPGGGLKNWTLGIPTTGLPALTVQKSYDNRFRITSEAVTGHD